MKTAGNHAHDDLSGWDVERKLHAIGWGAFFLWVGIARLAGVSWGVGLLGTGLIILGAQVARKYWAVEVEKFWIAIGLVFGVSGVLQSFNIHIRLVPIVCVFAGIALLVSAFMHRRTP
jgi:hypothetical protein